MSEIEQEAQFLVERLRSFENDNSIDDESFREWAGHISPSIARLEQLLKARGQEQRKPEPVMWLKVMDDDTRTSSTMDAANRLHPGHYELYPHRVPSIPPCPVCYDNPEEPANQWGVCDDCSARPERIPEGWALVPQELTPEMREAFHRAEDRYQNGYGESPDSHWRVMLGAAPTPPGECTEDDIPFGIEELDNPPTSEGGDDE